MEGWSKQDACGQQEMPGRKRTSMASRHWDEGLRRVRAGLQPCSLSGPVQISHHAQGTLPGKFPSSKLKKTPNIFSKRLVLA